MTPGTLPRWLNEEEMRFWRTFIVTSMLLDGRLNRELVEQHGLSHDDYVILVVLSEQDDHRMRMSALAELVVSSKSKLSHQVSRLERAGMLRRDDCVSDGRGVFAVLTPEGYRMLERAAPTHVEGVRRHLVDLVTPDERAQLTLVFERVSQHLRGEG
ncbi:MAG: MarR family transcriptional regulator [Pseudonocardiales bacterium]|nr:MarR family transcriptional regulator [Pseudonocardiales bacterium]